jgi:hypothetical protein
MKLQSLLLICCTAFAVQLLNCPSAFACGGDDHTNRSRQNDYCEKNPLSSGCEGSSAYCDRFPLSSECEGSKQYCDKFPMDDSCKPTGGLCVNNPNHPDCKRDRGSHHGGGGSGNSGSTAPTPPPTTRSSACDDPDSVDCTLENAARAQREACRVLGRTDCD